MKADARIMVVFALVMCSVAVIAQQNPQQWAIDNYRKYTLEARQCSDRVKESDIERFRGQFQKKGYRKKEYDKGKLSWQKALDLLTDKGTFSDMEFEELRYFPANGAKSAVKASEISTFASEIWYRLGRIADAYATGKVPLEQVYTDNFLKAIVHYGQTEISRSNYVSRFHESCFAIPTSAMNIYYAFLDEMNRIESGRQKTQLEIDVCVMLKTVALQAWTQPIRKDATDDNVSSIERFRHHVWWVGGNALAYRSLLPIACMYKSIPMIDVLAEVSQKGISCTSQLTNETSFWTEGFTADGAGWGHGKQCLVWGYPIDGTSAALNLLSLLKGSAWEQELSSENKAAIMNYLRGSNWYYYKGYNLPCLGRGTFVYQFKPECIKSQLIVKTILKDWQTSFSETELAELKTLAAEIQQLEINMTSYQAGLYEGTRYFFNNDDLIKKSVDYHLIVNMASVRCDGIESAIDFADEYNFTTCDGMTLFQRSGNEYGQILGAFDVLAAPGITARMGMEKLTPVTNWRGYCSKHNFAGGAANGGKNAVAGYVFEKMNASAKENVNDKAGLKVKNQVLYGVKAYKGYFIFGDYFLALGAGITNKTPEVEGDIHTTIEQTALQNDVYLLKAGKKTTIGEGVQTFGVAKKGLTWLVQEGKFAYTELPEYAGKAYFSTETRACDWVKMNVSNRGKQFPQEAKVLKMWINHGAVPQNDRYAYAVYMGKGTPAQKLPFNVLQNDTLLQAAASLDGKILEAVFYSEKQTLTTGNLTLSVSAPAVVLLEAQGKTWQVTVCDPQMNPDLKELTLMLNGKAYRIIMPQDDKTGKPVICNVSI